MKAKMPYRNEPKKATLRRLFRKAESSFQEARLVSYAKVFLAVGERSAELLTELQAMQKILRRVAEADIIPAERRLIRRRLNRIIDFSNVLDDYGALDLNVLEQLHLQLETEFAAIRPSFDILRGIYEYPDIAATCSSRTSRTTRISGCTSGPQLPSMLKAQRAFENSSTRC